VTDRFRRHRFTFGAIGCYLLVRQFIGCASDMGVRDSARKPEQTRAYPSMPSFAKQTYPRPDRCDKFKPAPRGSRDRNHRSRPRQVLPLWFAAWLAAVVGLAVFGDRSRAYPPFPGPRAIGYRSGQTTPGQALRKASGDDIREAVARKALSRTP